METLNYIVKINADKQKVWDTITNKEKYKKWSNVQNSTFIGNWKEGEEIKFIDPDIGGTLAKLEIVNEYEQILAKHIAIITNEGEKDTVSSAAESWIGTTEDYKFSEENGETTLKIEIQTNENNVNMFEESWPKSLDRLKELCEKE